MTSSRGVDVGTVGNCRGRWGIVGNCGELWGRVGMFHTTVLITPLAEASTSYQLPRYNIDTHKTVHART